MNSPTQLLLAKQLYEDGCRYASIGDGLSCLKAAVLLDLAVETVLNLLVRELTPDAGSDEVGGRRDVDWARLWQLAVQATKAKKGKLPQFRSLKGLHEVRNLAQHNGTVPAAIEVQRYTAPVGVFLRTVIRSAFGLDIDNFRPWDLVANESLRELLKEADEALKRGRVEHAIIRAKLANNSIVAAVRNQRFSGDQHIPEVIDGAYRDLSLRLYSLEAELAAIAVGMPIMDVFKFEHAGRGVSVTFARGGFYAESRSGTSFSSDDAAFMLEYLCRLIRLLCDNYPGLVDSIDARGVLINLES